MMRFRLDNLLANVSGGLKTCQMVAFNVGYPSEPEGLRGK